MEPLHIVVSVLFLSLIRGLILPVTKPDGTLDVSSLMSHIALLEQSIKEKASTTEVEQLKSDLAMSQKDLAASKNELSNLTSDLAAAQKQLGETKANLTQDLTVSQNQLFNLTTELAVAQKELGETKIKLTQVETNLTAATDELTKLKNDQDVEMRQVKSDLKQAEIEIAVLKNQLSQKVNTSGSGDSLTSNVSHLQSDVAHLQTEVSQLQSLHNKTGTQSSIPADFNGATFTRWGRTSCPNDSNIVYKGYTGGTQFTDKASAANILCLPDQPIYANHTDISHGDYHVSHIYGTEYQINYNGGPFEVLTNEDMPCVVCESRSSKVIMIPARSQCYSGWTLEYSGYLLGPYFQYASGEYICVDSDAEAIPGGHDVKYGQVLFPVEGRCGSLPCPPYHDGWELTCVVCSK